MSKLSKEDKIEIHNQRQQGKSITNLACQFNINVSNIKYLLKLIDVHGLSILDKQGNRKYSTEIKQIIINKVLIEKRSTKSVAIEYALPSAGMLTNWIKKYKENGYTIVEKPKGRKSTMKQPTKAYKDMTDAEKIAYLENKNNYLEAENDYLKKLDALIQKKNKKSQQKKK